MLDLEKNQFLFRLLMSVWFIAIFFSAVMYTIGLFYEEKIVIIIAGVTGLISLTGIIYTGYCLIRIKNSIKYFKEKNKN